eukprot:scaffold79182_cov51-Prasinocladus_malaysianus.AAC.11
MSHCRHSSACVVAGRIISLSLPINAVYERIWRPALSSGRQGSGFSSSNGPPMLVTYRLQGLDGEATEPMVSELEEVVGVETNPQEEYAVASVLAEGIEGGICGLALLTQHLASLPPYAKESFNSVERQPVSALVASHREALAKILQASMHLEPCRSAALKAGAMSFILRTVHAGLLSLMSGGPSTPRLGVARASAKDAVAASSCRFDSCGLFHGHRTGAAATEEKLLLVLEQLVEAAASESPEMLQSELLSMADDEASSSSVFNVDSSVLLHQLAECLTGLVENGHGNLANILARVMPFLAAHNPSAQGALLDRFATSIDFHKLDQDDDSGVNNNQQQLLDFNSFLKLAEELGTDQDKGSAADRGGTFRRLVLDRGIPKQAADYLLEVFAEADFAGQSGLASGMGSSTSPAWATPGSKSMEMPPGPSLSVPASPSTPMVSPIGVPLTPMPIPIGSAIRRRDS